MKFPYKILLITAISLIAFKKSFAQDTTYLKGLPNPLRILTEVKGKNTMDTYARQAATLHTLRAVVYMHGLFREFAPEEDEVIKKYNLAEGIIFKNAEKMFGVNSATELRSLKQKFNNDEAFNEKVKQEFLSPETYVYHKKTLKEWNEKRDKKAAFVEEEQKRKENAENIEILKNISSGILNLIFWLIFWLVFIGIIIFIFYKLLNRGKANHQKLTKAADVFNRSIFEEFLTLGKTKEEREKNIKKIFYQKNKTIHFQWYWVHPEKYKVEAKEGQSSYWTNDKYYCYKKIKISRNLASMEAREREFLQTVLLLFNEKNLSSLEYRDFLFAFVNGDGKAGIIDYNYYTHPEYSGVKDGPTTVKYIMDNWGASVDNAISKLLVKIGELENSDHKTKPIKEIKNRIHGNGAWLSDDELEGTIYNGIGDYKLNLGSLEDGETTLHYSGGGSLITIAPPGSGKTQCFVYPNLLNWKSSAVVLDIKPEIYKATHKWREENVGKVFKFDPLNPEESHCYNPLTFVREEPEYIWEDSGFLAEMMIVPSSASDPFWENMARDVLTSAIAYVVFNNEVDNRPMSKVLDIMYGIGWEEMVTSLKTNVLVSSMRRMGTTLEDMEKKQRDSVLKTAQSSLSAWSGTRMEKITTKSDWNPAEIRKGTQTIYICIKASEIDKYISVLRVFLAQHIQLLLDEKELQHDREKIAYPILFMLDEFPQLKRMPPIEKALNVGAGYGIRLWMFAQSYGQLKEAYPNAEGLVGSCAVRTFMNLPITDEYTAKVSEMLGKRNDALGNKEEPLASPRDLAGSDFKDYVLVLATGTKPAKVKKKFAYQDERIKAKMK